MHACCLCVYSACLPRHVAIAIDLSDVAACAKECSSVGAQKQVTQKDRLVAGFIVEDTVARIYLRCNRCSCPGPRQRQGPMEDEKENVSGAPSGGALN